MAYLPTFLAAFLVRIGFVERVDRLVFLEMFLEELEAGLPCDVRVHGRGWRKRSGGRGEPIVSPASMFLSPHPGHCGALFSTLRTDRALPILNRSLACCARTASFLPPLAKHSV